jgi:hypothetical protein
MQQECNLSFAILSIVDFDCIHVKPRASTPETGIRMLQWVEARRVDAASRRSSLSSLLPS